MNKPISLSTAPLYYSFFDSPIGVIGVGVTHKGVKAVAIVSSPTEVITHMERVKLPLECDHPKCAPMVSQLREYFEGKRKQFTLPIDWDDMSPFQEKVLRATLTIPYGETRTYGELAAQVSTPSAARRRSYRSQQPHSHHYPLPPRYWR